MDGTGGEAKLFFESIYNTITEIAAEGSLFQGRDISHHVYNIVSALYTSLRMHLSDHTIAS